MNDLGPDLIADVTFYPTERGGRREPTGAKWFGCPCTPKLDPPEYWDCRLFYETPIHPGETRRVAVKFLHKDAVPIFQAAGHFYLWDMRIIGKAVIIPNTTK
jgi:hypothetical protein